jgi:peptidyl-prolyl cis-trans isomerase D
LPLVLAYVTIQPFRTLKTVKTGLPAMLNYLRDSLKKGTWPKVVLAATAIGLVAYLGAYFSGDGAQRGTGEYAALVGGQKIAVRDFLQTARQIDQRYRDMFGSNYEQFKQQARIGSQAIQVLVERELVRQDATRLGLSASPDELIEHIRTMDELQDPSGRFVGKERYVQIIDRGYPGGVVAFEQALMNDLLMDRWFNMVTQPATVNEAEVEAAYRQQNERTSIDYVLLPASEQEFDADVADGDAARWYQQHQELYLRDEGRRVRYLLVARQQQLDKVSITEDEIQAQYQADLESYSHPEQRQARHILFRPEPGASDEDQENLRRQAEGVLGRLRDGEDFAVLASALSQDPGSAQRGGDLGFFSRGDMVPPFEQAAFGTPVGDLAPVVETQFGYHIIQVTAERQAGNKPLEDVKDDIRRSLELRRADDMVASTAQRLHEELQSADQLEAIAAREELVVNSVFVNPASRLPEIGPSPEFISTIMELEPGAISPPLPTARGMALVVVDDIVPTSAPPLEEIAATVRTDVQNDRAKQAAVANAERALLRHKNITAAAAALNKEVLESGNIAPGQDIPGSGGSSPQLLEKLFGPEVRAGDTGVIPVPAGAMVYAVTERQQFDPAAFTEAKGELRGQLLDQRRNMLRQSILNQLAEELQVTINEELVQQYDG